MSFVLKFSLDFVIKCFLVKFFLFFFKKRNKNLVTLVCKFGTKLLMNVFFYVFLFFVLFLNKTLFLFLFFFIDFLLPCL